MKYSLFFAATAAASYDAYGGYQAQSSSVPSKPSSVAPAYDNYGGYAAQSSSVPSKPSSSAPVYGGYAAQSSSVPSKPSSSAPVYGGYSSSSVKSSNSSAKATPCSTVSGSNGHATIVPGYGKPPVTISAQHQSYPTCVAQAYDGKSCNKWGDDTYVSTVITDYNKKTVTITKVDDYVTVYQEKKTVTHYATASSTIGGYGAISTGTPAHKNSTVWYELYEKVILCKYAECGKNVLGGYPGSGLCKKCDDEQPVTEKEYKGGKWTEEKKTLNYGKPKDEVKVYEKTGVYTVPAKTVTVYGKPSGKPSHDSSVYTFPPKVITITKPGQPYTCTYELPKQSSSAAASKTPSKGDNYPVTVTKTPVANDYGYNAPSATPTPKKPTNDNGYPSYPVHGNSTSSAHKASSTPCDESKTLSTATSSKSVYYGEYSAPSSTPSKPSSTPAAYYGAPSSTPSKPSSTPPAMYYGDNSAPSSSAPSKPSSTPCTDDKTKPTPTPAAYEAPNYTPAAPYEQPKPTPTPAAYEAPKYTPAAPYEAPKPTPTPAAYEAPKPTPAAYEAPKYTPAAPYQAPKETPAAYEAPKATYPKRGGMMERRKAVMA